MARNCTETALLVNIGYRVARQTLVLLHTIKRRWLKHHRLAPKPIDLPRYRPPKHLIEHGVRHVVVATSAFMFGNSEGVLNYISEILAR